VLDWELCTLGDPLADLGWLVAYWIEPGEASDHMHRRQPTVLPGFPGRAAIVERYVGRTGIDASELDFYTALALWKLACIAEGVYARYRAGVMGAEDAAAVTGFGGQVLALAQASVEVSERLR
jgi:aminoglycoside phosphotransferase (APT) family kinase protein